MTIIQIDPYLIFPGTAAKAIALYERALGAVVEQRMSYAEGPDCGGTAADKDRVLHARLRIGKSIVLLSDAQPKMAVAADSNVQVCLHFDDILELERRFTALADGGQIVMPVADAFWGSRFGMLVDAYAVRWMFECPLPKG